MQSIQQPNECSDLIIGIFSCSNETNLCSKNRHRCIQRTMSNNLQRSCMNCSWLNFNVLWKICPPICIFYYDEPNFGPSESFNSEHDEPSDTSLLQTILDSSSFAHYSRFMENFESPLPPDQILHGQTEGQHNSTNVTSPKRQPRPPTPFFFGYTEAQDQ